MQALKTSVGSPTTVLRLDRGPAKLAYVKRAPAKPTRQPGVLYLPGLQSNKNGTKALALEEVVEKRLGCGFVRFDYSGHGESLPGPDEFRETNPSWWLDDARAVLDQVADGPQIVVGSSVGALLALRLAAERPDKVAGLVLVAPAMGFSDRLWGLLDASQQRTMLGGGAAKVDAELIDCDTAARSPSEIKINFFREARKLAPPMVKGSIPVTCAVRILHGSRDKAVPLEASLQLLRRLESADVTLTVLKGAEHRLSRPDELGQLSAALLQLWEQVGTRDEEQ